MDMLVVALWVGAAVSICFVAHEYYGYWHEFHRARLMKRLDIYDVPGLVRLAARVGLVSIDQ